MVRKITEISEEATRELAIRINAVLNPNGPETDEVGWVLVFADRTKSLSVIMNVADRSAIHFLEIAAEKLATGEEPAFTRDHRDS